MLRYGIGRTAQRPSGQHRPAHVRTATVCMMHMHLQARRRPLVCMLAHMRMGTKLALARGLQEASSYTHQLLNAAGAKQSADEAPASSRLCHCTSGHLIIIVCILVRSTLCRVCLSSPPLAAVARCRMLVERVRPSIRRTVQRFSCCIIGAKATRNARAVRSCPGSPCTHLTSSAQRRRSVDKRCW